jgi:hypothetical protein
MALIREGRVSTIKKALLAGILSGLWSLPSGAAVSEALCTAFTNAMAEFSAKLPMTVSMPSNVTRGRVDKSNALVWLPTTYTEVAFDCDTGTVIYSLKPGTVEASNRLLKRSSPTELGAFKAIQDDMACKPDGFVRSHGVSEMRLWHSYDGTLWQSFTTTPEDCG